MAEVVLCVRFFSFRAAAAAAVFLLLSCLVSVLCVYNMFCTALPSPPPQQPLRYYNMRGDGFCCTTKNKIEATTTATTMKRNEKDGKEGKKREEQRRNEYTIFDVAVDEI